MLFLFISFYHLKDNNSGTKRRTLSQLVEFSLLIKVLLSLHITFSSDTSVLGKPQPICWHFYLGIARKGGGSKGLPGWFGALI